MAHAKRSAGFALAALLVLAACGGGPPGPSADRTPTPTPPTSGSPSPTISSEPGPTGKATPTSKPPNGSPKPTATGTPEFAATGSLDKACVHRGVATDMQGLTVKTLPKDPVGYVTTYSDGSSNFEHPEWGNAGRGGGFADDSGTFRETWIVPATAPTGTAVVRVIARGGTIDLPFRVVAATGKC